ncbi:PQ loop repeat-domain-containing protein, partial [Dissophora ornata]
NLSNLAGTLSIICWFIVFTPQFWINYKRQSGESLSLTFLYIWLAGDLFNVVGATMDNLLLTMRILAWYYTLADTLLIAQVFYYRRNYSAIEPTPSISSTMSFSKGPDLEQQQQQQRRRHCHLPIDPSAQRRLSTASEHTRTLPSRRRLRKLVLILLPILTATFFVLAYVEWRQRVLDNRGRDKGKGEEGMGGWLALFFGWGSALLYLGSRIPQLYKNWRLQSCEGLSIMMFTFSVLGNMLYVASIFLSSTDPDYLWRNMPWWLGSLGTLVFDISIFAQFFMYRNNKHPQDDEQD